MSFRKVTFAGGTTAECAWVGCSAATDVRAPWIVAILVLLNALLLRAVDPPELSRLRDIAFDNYPAHQAPRPTIAMPVRIVDIDEAAPGRVRPMAVAAHHRRAPGRQAHREGRRGDRLRRGVRRARPLVDQPHGARPRRLYRSRDRAEARGGDPGQRPGPGRRHGAVARRRWASASTRGAARDAAEAHASAWPSPATIRQPVPAGAAGYGEAARAARGGRQGQWQREHRSRERGDPPRAHAVPRGRARRACFPRCRSKRCGSRRGPAPT